MKTRLVTHVDGYHLTLPLSFNKHTLMVLTSFYLLEIPVKVLVRILAYFLFFRQKVVLRVKLSIFRCS